MDRWESLLLAAAESHPNADEIRQIADPPPTGREAGELDTFENFEKMKLKLKEFVIKQNLSGPEQAAMLQSLYQDIKAEEFVDLLETKYAASTRRKRAEEPAEYLPDDTPELTTRDEKESQFNAFKGDYTKLKSLYDNLIHEDQLLLKDNLLFYRALVDIIKSDEDPELSGFIGLLLFMNSREKMDGVGIDVEDYLRMNSMELLQNPTIIEMIKKVLKRREIKYLCNKNLLEQKNILKNKEKDLGGVIIHPLAANTSLMDVVEHAYANAADLTKEERSALDELFEYDGSIIKPKASTSNSLLRTINFKIQGSNILNTGSAAVLPVKGKKKPRKYFEVCQPTVQCANVGIIRMSESNFLDYKNLKDSNKKFGDLLRSPPVAHTIFENMKRNTNVKPCYICNHKIIAATQLNRAKLGNNSNECEHVIPCVVFTLMFGLSCHQDMDRVKDFIYGAAFQRDIGPTWRGVPETYIHIPTKHQPDAAKPDAAKQGAWHAAWTDIKKKTFDKWHKINVEICEKEYFSSHALCNGIKSNHDYILIDINNIYGKLDEKDYQSWLPNGWEAKAAPRLVFDYKDFKDEFDEHEITLANDTLKKLKEANDWRGGDRYGFKCSYDIKMVKKHLLDILTKAGVSVATTSICGMLERDVVRGVDQKKCYAGEIMNSEKIIEDRHFSKRLTLTGKKNLAPEEIFKAQLEHIFKYGPAPPYLPSHANPKNRKGKPRLPDIKEKNKKWRCPKPQIPGIGKAEPKNRNILDKSSLYYPNEPHKFADSAAYEKYLHESGEGICDYDPAKPTAASGTHKWIGHRVDSIRIRCLLLLSVVFKYNTEAIAFNYWLTARAYLNNYLSITGTTRTPPAEGTLLSSNSIPYISIQNAIETVRIKLGVVQVPPAGAVAVAIPADEPEGEPAAETGMMGGSTKSGTLVPGGRCGGGCEHIRFKYGEDGEIIKTLVDKDGKPVTHVSYDEEGTPSKMPDMCPWEEDCYYLLNNMCALRHSPSDRENYIKSRAEKRTIDLNIKCRYEKPGVVCPNLENKGRCYYRHSKEVLDEQRKTNYNYEERKIHWTEVGRVIVVEEAAAAEAAAEEAAEAAAAEEAEAAAAEEAAVESKGGGARGHRGGALKITAKGSPPAPPVYENENISSNISKIKAENVLDVMLNPKVAGGIITIEGLIEKINNSSNWEKHTVISIPNVVNNFINGLPENIISYIINESIEPQVKESLNENFYYFEDIEYDRDTETLLSTIGTQGLDMIDNIVDYFGDELFNEPIMIDNELFIIEELDEAGAVVSKGSTKKTKRRRKRRKKTTKTKKTKKTKKKCKCPGQKKTRRNTRKTRKTRRRKKKHTRKSRIKKRREERKTIRKSIRKSIRRSIGRSIKRSKCRRTRR